MKNNSKESELTELLNRSQEIAHLGSWMFDPTSNLLTWSDEVYRIFGLHPQESTATYEGFLDAVYPDDRAAVDAAYSGSIKEGKDSYEIEHRVVRKHTGEIRYVHEKCKHDRDASGSVIRSVGFVQDITERKKAEFELLKFKEAVDSSADDIYIIDREKMLFIDFNASALRSLGYAKEELLKMGPPDIKPLMSRNKLAEIFDKIIHSDSKFGRIETVHRRKDGTRFDVEVFLRSFHFSDSTFLVASVRDITERKKIEETLLISQDRLHFLLNSTSSITYAVETEPPNRVTFVSENVTTLTGYTPEEFAKDPAFWADHIHPGDQERILRELPLLFEKGNYLREYRLRFKDGTYHWMRDDIKLNYDAQGKPVEMVGNCVDITESKKVEDQLKEFKYFFNNSGDLCCIANMQGYFETLNPNFEKVLGFSRKELLEIPFMNFVHPDDFPATLQEIERLKAGSLTINFVNRYRKKDGEYLWFDWNATPDPVTKKLYAIARDITERKKAEEILLKTLKEISDYKYALDESLIVAITHKNGIIKFVNDNFCKISKFSREELLGKDHRIVSSGYHPKEFIRNLWETIAKGEVWRGELKNRAKDGTIYWVDSTIVPFLNEEGKPYQYVSIRSDITDRKKKEAENQNLNKELESFSYSVSHDLRAPLRALEGFGKALSEKYKGKFDEEADRWIDFITMNAKRMDLLISDMLNFSRISRESIKNRSINMKVLAQQCFESSKTNYPEKIITFNLENIPDSFGDFAMVKQVWQNLISNALKYSSKNKNITISITGKIESDYSVYSIRDNGVGFDEKYTDKMFGVFQRLHSSREFEGTGVGLAIVSRIIQKHNGWINANGQSGKGAEFTFALPFDKKLEL
ncbi:MAG: PAS domain S-box protein [Bacteroidota bacterium]